MRFFWVFLSLVLAFWLELILGRWLALAQIPPPLTAAVLFFWFWKVGLVERMVWGLGAGIFMDTLYPEPFGAHVFIFLLLAFLIGFLQSFFSNIESPLTHGIAMTISLFLFFNSLPFASLIFYNFYGRQIWINPPPFKVLSASLIWSLPMPIIILGLVKLAGRSR